MNALIWHDEQLGAKFDVVEIPEEYKAKADELHMQLVEMAVEEDEALLEAYLDGKLPTVEQLKACIRKGTTSFRFVPVMCGSAFKNKGVQPLLDAVVDYLPSPLDIPPVMGIVPGKDTEVERPADDKAPFAGLAFKIMDDPFVGSITFVRVYSGSVTSGTTVLNSVKDKNERVGRMLLMHANSREDVKEAYAGDIVAFAGLKLTTPARRCAIGTSGDPGAHGIPRSGHRSRDRAEDQGRPGKDGHGACASGPGRSVLPRLDRTESGQTILKGMGELHLEIKVDILRRTYKVDANVGAPQVAYRETLSKPVTIQYTHKKQTGGSGQFAEVKIEFEPLPAGLRLRVRERGRRRLHPEGIHSFGGKGHRAQKESGLLAGFPVIDFQARLVDGKYHEVDSNALTFDIAARAAFANWRRAGVVKLLEPIMKVEVVTPDDFLGGVIGDLNRVAARCRAPTARQRAGRHRDGAACEHVRLHQHAALHDPGSCAVLDAVRPLRAGSAGDRGRSQSEVRLT